MSMESDITYLQRLDRLSQNIIC